MSERRSLAPEEIEALLVQAVAAARRGPTAKPNDKDRRIVREAIEGPKAQARGRLTMAALLDPRAVSGPVCVDVRFTLRRPASRSSRRFPFPITRPDVDKLLRAALDALTDVVFVDDAQVVDVRARKAYDDDGPTGLALTVREVTA